MVGATVQKRRRAERSIVVARRATIRLLHPQLRAAIRFVIACGISHPAVNRGLAPTATIVADLDLARKGSLLHFSVKRGAAETNALQN